MKEEDFAALSRTNNVPYTDIIDRIKHIYVASSATSGSIAAAVVEVQVSSAHPFPYVSYSFSSVEQLYGFMHSITNLQRSHGKQVSPWIVWDDYAFFTGTGFVNINHIPAPVFGIRQFFKASSIEAATAATLGPGRVPKESGTNTRTAMLKSALRRIECLIDLHGHCADELKAKIALLNILDLSPDTFMHRTPGAVVMSWCRKNNLVRQSYSMSTALTVFPQQLLSLCARPCSIAIPDIIIPCLEALPKSGKFISEALFQLEDFIAFSEPGEAVPHLEFSTVEILGTTIQPSNGGLHGALPKYATDERNSQVIAFDIKSMYPSIMCSYDLTSRLFAGMPQVRDIIELRDSSASVERRKALKLFLNTIYGMHNTKSAIRDPIIALSICLTGQLVMLMTLEIIEQALRTMGKTPEGDAHDMSPYVTLVQTNTDGAMFEVRDPDPSWGYLNASALVKKYGPAGYDTAHMPDSPAAIVYCLVPLIMRALGEFNCETEIYDSMLQLNINDYFVKSKKVFKGVGKTFGAGSEMNAMPGIVRTVFRALDNSKIHSISMEELTDMVIRMGATNDYYIHLNAPAGCSLEVNLASDLNCRSDKDYLQCFIADYGRMRSMELNGTGCVVCVDKTGQNKPKLATMAPGVPNRHMFPAGVTSINGKRVRWKGDDGFNYAEYAEIIMRICMLVANSTKATRETRELKVIGGSAALF